MLAGAVLIAVGVVALAYQTAAFFLKRPSVPPPPSAAKPEKVANVGPFEIIGPQEETLPMTSIVGTFALTGGIFLLVLGSRKG